MESPALCTSAHPHRSASLLPALCPAILAAEPGREGVMAGKKQEELDGLVAEIITLWKDADEQQITADTKRIEVGRKLLEAKLLVRRLRYEWDGWVKKNLHRSVRDANRCIELVEGRTDEQALEALCAYREKAKLGMRNARARQNGASGTNVSPGAAAKTPQNAQPARATPETVSQEPLEVFEASVKQYLDELTDEDLRTFCDWVRDYEAQRLGDQNSGADAVERSGEERAGTEPAAIQAAPALAEAGS
jgi:hypothetical protein